MKKAGRSPLPAFFMRMKRSALMVACVLNPNCKSPKALAPAKDCCPAGHNYRLHSKRRANTGSVGALQYCVRKCLT